MRSERGGEWKVEEVVGDVGEETGCCSCGCSSGCGKFVGIVGISECSEGTTVGFQELFELPPGFSGAPERWAVEKRSEAR